MPGRQQRLRRSLQGVNLALEETRDFRLVRERPHPDYLVVIPVLVVAEFGDRISLALAQLLLVRVGARERGDAERKHAHGQAGKGQLGGCGRGPIAPRRLLQHDAVAEPAQTDAIKSVMVLASADLDQSQAVPTIRNRALE
jgi:hypothetical protein